MASKTPPPPIAARAHPPHSLQALQKPAEYLLLPWPRDWPLAVSFPIAGGLQAGRGQSWVWAGLLRNWGAQLGDSRRKGVPCKGLRWGCELLSQNGTGSLGDPRGHFSEPQFSCNLSFKSSLE